MCGRMRLTLNCDNVRSACAYKSSNGDVYRRPDWINEHNQGKTYKPSSNIAPTDVTPVLVSSPQFIKGKGERILKPMVWGMIPPWHKAEMNKHGLTTNNCRIENIKSSKLYGPSLRDGKRCIIVAEGFYEWQTTDKSCKTKQPYYIYFPQKDGILVDNTSTWTDTFDECTGWHGINLLKMAGLYNIWDSPDGPVYSYSIITMQSSSTINWIHHRMPAMLDSDELVTKWLDTENVSADEAVDLLKPTDHLCCHPVSTLVNNVRNKDLECNKRISLDDKSKHASSTQKVMTAWLTTKSDKKIKSPASIPKKVMTDWLSGKSSKRKSEGPNSECKRSKEEE